MAHDHPAASRRRFLRALAAASASLALPAGGALAAPAAPRRIDVHHHFFPPDYLEPLAEWGKRAGPGGLQPAQRDWSIAGDLEEMDRSGVATAILSISTPGIYFGDQQRARRMARLCNDYAARMVQDHPGRFGLFAAVPMPDVDGTLAEIAYALDVLKADGIGLMTSYDDLYPGDKRFAAVLEEVNRRRAIAYFHPLAAPCCGHLQPGIPASLLEFPQDTARAVVSLLFNGALAKYGQIRFLFSHAGGTIPMLAGRVAAGSTTRKDLDEIAPGGIDRLLKGLYYDTANSAYAPTMAALLNFVPFTQVLFGSDYPYYAIAHTSGGLAQLHMSAQERHAIDRTNAELLMPRLRTKLSRRLG